MRKEKNEEISERDLQKENLKLKYSNKVNELTNTIKKEEKERNNVEAQMEITKADMARKLNAKASDYMQLKAKSAQEMEQMRKEKNEEISERDLQKENLKLKYSNKVNELTKAIGKEEKERNNVEAQMELTKADMSRKLNVKTSDYMQLKAKSAEE